MNKKFTTIGFAAIALLGVAAQGAIVTEKGDSDTFGPLPPGVPSFTLSLDKFDPSKGTLISVSLVLDLRVVGSSLTFDNETASSGPVTLNFSVGATATTGGPSVLSVGTVVAKSGMGMVTADNDGAADFLGSDSFSISGAGIANNFTTQTAPAFLTQYTATVPGETFLVTVSNTNSTGTTAMFGPTSIVNGTFAGAVTVSYTYMLAAVPEAASALWGAALGLFAISRRVRSRRA